MGSYIASDRLYRGLRKAHCGAQHRSIESYSHLEKAADAFSQTQNETCPARTGRMDRSGWTLTEPKAKTETCLASWKHSAPRPTLEAFPREGAAPTRDAKGYAVYAPCAKNVYNMQMDNDERFGICGRVVERERRRLRKQAS